MYSCHTIGCGTLIESPSDVSIAADFCERCLSNQTAALLKGEVVTISTPVMGLGSMSGTYPKYFKDVSDLDEVDVYLVHDLFQVQDYSGCLHHASKKLLLSGVRTGNKSKYKDIKEARDTLTRWLQINPEPE